MTATNSHRTISGLELTLPVETDSTTEISLLPPPDVLDSSEVKSDNDASAPGPDQAEPDETAVQIEGGDAQVDPVRGFNWKRVLVYIALSVLVLALTLGAGYLKWQAGAAQYSQEAAEQSVRAATETTIAMLSYNPENADRDLTAASERLTGAFRDDYLRLIHDVVIPGAKKKQVSAVATVPAAASVSASRKHAVALVFVDQTTIIGNDPPSNTTSSVLVTLEKVHDQWLLSQFDPV
ncbi:hypothetical protein [Mycolicibacter kumamotonensis]|uniref:Mce associated membrane protein n=1 Tax=Mycolicibacter kumamotonensis TaxID=354243 RepID=A0A7K3LBF5_9MYCO|nr:hypothetical protein [Mycolicibacter kumamotonensis]NDJ89694.1 hypothetical protein [Mycolicibacter kumamotonensis]